MHRDGGVLQLVLDEHDDDDDPSCDHNH